MNQKADCLVTNCRQLLTLKSLSSGPRRGADLADIGLVENGVLAAFEGRVVAAGPADDVLSRVTPDSNCRQVDAGGAVVMPGFVDCHTHTCFGAYRLDEYEKRVLGVPYAEIAREGGGIAKSVSHVRQMDEDRLFEVSAKRLEGCLRHGSTTVEIKSGYGINLDNEMKQLRVIRRLAETSPATIVATFLGAHTLMPEYADNRDEFVDSVVHDMIPVVAKEGLAEQCDVFSEVGVFTTDEAERILRAGIEEGLKARVHADELNDTGSAEMAARIGAMSADHLPKISSQGIAAMAASSTIGVVLPGTSFGLPSLHFAPVREMIEKGMAVAIATDFNPGSSPTESMPMVISIACSHMGLSPAEAVAASTYNAAFVLARESEVGSLEPGKKADFLILDCEDFREIPYRVGVNPIDRVFIGALEWTS